MDWLLVAVESEGYYYELDRNENIIVEPSILAASPTYGDHMALPEVRGFRYTTTRRNPFGQFNIDQQRRVITFVGDFKARNVYVLYKSSGVPLEGKVYVPRQLATVLRTYLEWQLFEADNAVPVAKAQRAENLHGKALQLYYDNKDQVSGKELINLFNDPIQQGIKR
jgi:hypothetical protein